jgi:dihydrolipoamide dehydrogenase
LKKQTNKYISKIDEIYNNKFNENIEVFRGIGSFLSNNVVLVNGEKLTAPSIVIATGTKAKKPKYEKAWTSDDIFPFFSCIGLETKLIVRSQNILSNEDEEISSIFK